MKSDISEALEGLYEGMISDYSRWQDAGNKLDGSSEKSDIQKNMLMEYIDGIEIKEGSKYIKVISRNSVWGFIVSSDKDKKFKRGDILKAAGWNAPARNAARGNILEGDYTIRWTGPLYLK